MRFIKNRTVVNSTTGDQEYYRTKYTEFSCSVEDWNGLSGISRQSFIRDWIESKGSDNLPTRYHACLELAFKDILPQDSLLQSCLLPGKEGSYFIFNFLRDHNQYYSCYVHFPEQTLDGWELKKEHQILFLYNCIKAVFETISYPYSDSSNSILCTLATNIHPNIYLGAPDKTVVTKEQKQINHAKYKNKYEVVCELTRLMNQALINSKVTFRDVNFSSLELGHYKQGEYENCNWWKILYHMCYCKLKNPNNHLVDHVLGRYFKGQSEALDRLAIPCRGSDGHDYRISWRVLTDHIDRIFEQNKALVDNYSIVFQSI